MSGTIVALATAGCVFGGTLLGLAVRKFLPNEHLSDDSKDAVKVGAGMVSLMAALVLGLLVGSAKSKFDATNNAIAEGGAKVILLDRALANYGPETKELRVELRTSAAAMVALLWPEENKGKANFKAFEQAPGMEVMLQKLRRFKPETDSQRAWLQDAQNLGQELLMIRWLEIERSQTPLPGAMVAILLFWLSMLYMSFGLFAPRNATVITAMLIGALSLATAMFLIVEMNHPMAGALKVSSAPLVNAIEHLGR